VERRLISRGTSIVDVVIDPVLASLMRDHQKEGVKVSEFCGHSTKLTVVHVFLRYGPI
jgi:hypothetical protein